MFQAILAELVSRTPGTDWAMIVGADGVPLETKVSGFQTETELLAAEYAVLFRTCWRVASQASGSDLQGAILTTERCRIVVQTLTPDYFLLLCLQPTGLTGKALFEISRARGAIVEEITF
jgi:predicted regulator of Ras-like GTPase activity (Roadblock/LC7/MglB family)